MRASKRNSCEDYVGESNWVTMTIENNLTVEINATNPVCAGETGMLEAMAYGATGTVSYLWNNGSTMSMQTGVGSGNHIVTATDQGGCTASADAEIIIPTTLIASVTTTNLTALAADDGTALVTVSGGIPGYSYAWSNAETDTLITDLAPNTYYVTVTDSFGCSAVASGDVFGPIFSKGGGANSTSNDEVSITAYPNPLNGINNVSIRAEGLSDETIGTASVYDLQGQLIIKENVVFQNGSDAVEISTAGRLASGTYILRVETAEKIENINIQVLR